MIIFSLCRKGMPLDKVHDDLEHTLGAEGMAYSTVMKCAWSANFVPKKAGPSDEVALIESNAIDEAIFTTLADCLFSSIREPSGRTSLPFSTVHRHITQSLRFRIRHLRWIPGSLTVEQKQMRVKMSRELSRILSTDMSHQRHDIVTLDESWFEFRSRHDLI
jgi:hypothetical protein